MRTLVPKFAVKPVTSPASEWIRECSEVLAILLHWPTTCTRTLSCFCSEHPRSGGRPVTKLGVFDLLTVKCAAFRWFCSNSSAWARGVSDDGSAYSVQDWAGGWVNDNGKHYHSFFQFLSFTRPLRNSVFETVRSPRCCEELRPAEIFSEVNVALRPQKP